MRFLWQRLSIYIHTYLYESLPKLGHNPFWFTGLKAPTNHLNLCSAVLIDICAHIKSAKHWQPYMYLNTKIQHTLRQPSKTECGCLNGRTIENRHLRNSSPEEQVHYPIRRGMQKKKNYAARKFLFPQHLKACETKLPFKDLYRPLRGGFNRRIVLQNNIREHDSSSPSLCITSP